VYSTKPAVNHCADCFFERSFASESNDKTGGSGKKVKTYTSNKKTLLLMKKIILTLSLVALISSSFVSCSTDDSALQNDTANADLGVQIDNGDKDLPKPPMRP
jgi:hypothetical protein